MTFLNRVKDTDADRRPDDREMEHFTALDADVDRDQQIGLGEKAAPKGSFDKVGHSHVIVFQILD